MQKDIIYIDVEDDITAIIGKIKDSREKIIALVPPKRIGVLQSAVNLRLLERAASHAEKKLVLITNNDALSSLAGSAKIPVAKNLQSKPELAQIAALDLDDGEDVIDGAQLPVGEHARMADTPPGPIESAVATDIIDDDMPKNLNKAPAPSINETPKRGKAKNKPRVPNFDKFRKRLILIIIGAVVLLGLLVWAIFFAPRATVVISAKTTETGINEAITFSGDTTSAKDKLLKASTQSLDKTVSQTFDATGKKDVGSKATGTVSLSTRDIDNLGTIIPAGTTLTSSSGATYTTDSAVTMSLSNYRGATVSITASENGAKYNGARGSVSGTPSGISGSIQNATTGGVDKTITVVTADDIANAQKQLLAANTDQIQSQLAGQFDNSVIVLKQTFKSDTPDLSANPAEGNEAGSGKATLSGKITYTMMGVARDDISSYLDQTLKDQLANTSNQRVYENGSKNAKLDNVAAENATFGAQLTANGKIGPSINDASVKDMAKGKRLGEIQSSIESIQGVDRVDVKYWPFWVSSTPNDTNRIKVEFNLSGK